MKLSDRMKAFETQSTFTTAMPLVPLCARMDGKAFHTFTHGLKRPFDEEFSALMVATTKFLVKETVARIGYTQSDEISLIWYETDPETMLPFSGKLFKLTSILASMATAFFNQQLPHYLPEKVGQLPLFDARVWSVPTLRDAGNYLLWREQDATRNSINMAAQSVYSHKQLMGVNTKQAQEKLFQAGINWNDYPRAFKRGTLIQRKSTARAFTAEELEQLPPKHAARANPSLVVCRQEVTEINAPPLSKVDRVSLLFGPQP